MMLTKRLGWPIKKCKENILDVLSEENESTESNYEKKGSIKKHL